MNRTRYEIIGRACGPLCLAILCLLATALFNSAVALALTQRGHEFARSFTGPAGTGGVSEPDGMAVNEASGDIYVVDAGGDRIERFNAEGSFIAAWGWGVKDGAKEYEICESECLPGLRGAGKGELAFPGAIAVDNSRRSSDPSKGDVYLISDARAEHAHLQKFTAEGAPLTAVKQGGVEARWEGALDGLAVDASGRLWVYRGQEATGEIERFSDAARSVFEGPPLESTVPCPEGVFAVNPVGEDLYVGHERQNSEEGCPAQQGEPSRPVLSAKLKVEGESLATLTAGVDTQATTGVAVDLSTGRFSSGDVYVDNATSVAALTPEGALIQRFGAGHLQHGAGIAVNARTGYLYVADSTGNKIDVFKPQEPGPPTVDALYAAEVTSTTAKLDAQIDPGGAASAYTFEYGLAECDADPSACAKAPGAEPLPASFGDQPVELQLQNLEPATTYYYRLLASNVHGPAQGEESFATVTTPPEPQGLLPDARAWEMVSPPEKDGSGIDPITDTGGVIQASANGNAITYVADGPIVGEPSSSVAPEVTQVLSTRNGEGWLSQELVTPQNGAEGGAAYSLPEYQFFSPDLSLGLVQPPVDSGEEPLAHPPLSPPVLEGETQERTLYLRDDQPLQPEPSEQADFTQAEANRSYLAPGYLPLVDAANDETNRAFGGSLKFVSATQDLSHVVFQSSCTATLCPVGLTSSSGPEGNLYEWESGRPLNLISLLPSGVAAVGQPRLGQDSANVQDAISTDGTRVIWSSGSENPHHLYLRGTAPGHEQTLELSAAGPGIDQAEAGEGEVGYQAASSDGSKVFFTDTARLTEESNQLPVPGAESNPADLYECDLTTEVNGRLECHLKDLTVASNPGESADVLNVLPGASEDGSYVYFVANGKLTPEAIPGDCIHSAASETPPPGARCNLYLSYKGKLTFIAALSDEDSPDWGALDSPPEQSPVEGRPDRADVTSRVSPDGQYLAFMSNQELTGYDNVDANPEAKGAHDEEVFIYDAHTKRLTCVSCNPNSQTPHGVHDVTTSGEGRGLLVDRRGDWTTGEEGAAEKDTAHWLAGSIPGSTAQEPSDLADHQARYLLDNGRLYFNSPADLAKGAENGKEDVYQYEPNGVGGCHSEEGCVGLISSGSALRESAFLDSSESGDDVFFLTSQPLVGQDQDANFDVYDARVCSSSSPCLSQSLVHSQPCESAKTCNTAPPAGQPRFATPSSATFLGPPSVAGHGTLAEKGALARRPLTRAQMLAAALKSCKKRWKRSKPKRAACEAAVRKKYAPSRTAKARKPRGKKR